MENTMEDDTENSFENTDEDEVELPVIPPIKPGPDCPFCGEPTMMAEGGYICLDCNGSGYGPETG